jgi:hypothetical protein
VATSDEEGGTGTKRDHTSKSRGLGIEQQSCVRILSWTRDVIRASHVQGPGNTPLQPRSRTDRLRAILISGCHSVFTFLAHAFALPTRTSGNMPAFFGTGPPYGMRRSLGLGPFPSSAQPGDIFVGFARRRPPRPLCCSSTGGCCRWSRIGVWKRYRTLLNLHGFVKNEWLDQKVIA